MQENYKKDRPYNRDGKKPFKKRRMRRDFFVPGSPQGVKIPDESFGALEQGLKYLKRQMKDADIFGKVREKSYYEKPSQTRRVQKEEAVRNEQYKNKMEGGREKGYVWQVILDGQAQ